MSDEWKRGGKIEDWRVRIWYVVLLKMIYLLRDRFFPLFSGVQSRSSAKKIEKKRKK